jgi:hypothetical protein
MPQSSACLQVAAALLQQMRVSPVQVMHTSFCAMMKCVCVLQVHKRCGVKLHLSERKMGIMRCLDLPGAGAAAVGCPTCRH